MKTLKIADFYINIDSANAAYFEKRYQEYICDYVDNPHMVIKTIICERIAKPEGEIIAQNDSTYVVKTPDNNFCRFCVNKKHNTISYAINFNEDFSCVEIRLSKATDYTDSTLIDLEYVYTGYVFSNRVIYLGGIILHSSAICYNNKGIAFSADSGTGKSTHVALWKQRFNDDVTVINDDKPGVFFKNGKPYLFGNPWSGKTDINTDVSCPLSAIVFLERDQNNEISSMSISDSILNLRRQIPDSFFDANISEKTFDVIKKIYEANVPVYRLKCNISQEAVETVFEKVFGLSGDK